MNIRKINIGFLFLILTLVIVQGASAHPMKAAPTSNTGVASCQGCHDGAGGGGGFVCTDCHVYPTFYLTMTASPASVPALSPSDVTLTVGKRNTVSDSGFSGLIPGSSPAIGATVSLSGAGVSTSGTTDSTGIVTKTVNPTGAGTINADATITGFNIGSATVSVTVPVVVPVLTTITVTPSTTNVLVGATQTFTAAPKDQNGKPMVVTISWTSSNITVGTINSAGMFTALAAGTTKVKANTGAISSADVTVNVSVFSMDTYLAPGGTPEERKAGMIRAMDDYFGEPSLITKSQLLSVMDAYFS